MLRIPHVGLKFRCVLLTALVLVLLYAIPASAEENVETWEKIRTLVNTQNTVNIKLQADVTATQAINIGSGKQITIDLNGHTITSGPNVGVLFESWDGCLTIKDSQLANTVKETVAMPERFNQSANTVSNGTGIGRVASFENGNLTYYETTSVVNQEIYTIETHHKVTVAVKGRIVRNNGSDAPLIRIGGSNASLTIQGGFFSNPTGRALDIHNGTDVAIHGGIFYGCNTTGAGGAVNVDSWTEPRAQVVIENAIFAGNSAVSGGAVAVNGKVNLTIKDGAVFSGNKATGSGHDGGGAVMIGYESVATMTGGLITHNWCVDNVPGSNSDTTSYDVCGGGVMIRGAMKMTGGRVTANEAPGGGGIATSYWDGGVFAMTGGIVAGNVARLNEGGGITINMNGRGSITGGHITNNRVEGNQHWGGGGIFASNDSMLTMISTLITENEAGGFGGGLTGCSTARVDMHTMEMQTHSVAVYGNKAEGVNRSGNNSTKNEDHVYAYNDPVFMREGDFYQDYFSALNTTVCGGFLGGGNANWEGTIDSQIIRRGDIKPGEKVSSQSVAGLTSNPSATDIANAIRNAKVFVTRNSSYTHGGGILSNGYMIIGPHRKMEIGDRMILMGEKTISGSQLTDGQFKFAVTDQNGKVLFTGTNNAAGEIVFSNRLTFDNAGTYIYQVYELDEGIPANVTKDPAVYTINVQVSSTEKTQYAVNEQDFTKTDVVDITFNKISSVKIYKSGSHEPILELDDVERDDRSALMLPDDVLQFVNRTSTDTGFVVSKMVHDASNKSANAVFDFTVTLSDTSITGTYGQMEFNHGTAQFSLKEGESKKAIKLPAGITYTVKEAEKPGYFNVNYTHIGTVVQNTVTPVVFENYAVGSLTVTKTVESPVPGDKTRGYDYRITLLPGEGRTGVYGGVEFINGVAVVEIKDNGSISIPNLPAGKEYIVEELTTEGFEVVSRGSTGVITVGEEKVASFTNKRRTGELHIKKYVKGSSTNQKFDFTVTLTDADYINGTFGGMNFQDGVASVSLSHGETVKAIGLPQGIHYRVTEPHNADDAGYAVSVVGPQSGTITSVPAVVEFTNTEFAGLVISKTVTGSALDRENAFAFEITLADHENRPLSGEYSGVNFVNGKATIHLHDGQNQIFEDLLEGTKVTVREVGVDTDHFIIQLNGQSTNTVFTHTMQSGDHAHAHFTNLHRVGSLEISKNVVPPLTEDQKQEFVFRVALSAPLNGTFGDLYFTEGHATVYLKNGDSVKAENIPVGVTYTVTEEPNPDFNSMCSGDETGTISETGAVVAYTNERRLGGLKITKIVRGETQQDLTQQTFRFKVILDRPYSGTFGGMTFADGIAEFSLKAGDTIQATGLPAGTIYSIVETGYDSTHFVPEIGTVGGNIAYNQIKSVNFVNLAVDEPIATGSLKVSKTVTGNAAERDKTFAFTVTLSDHAINGAYGDMIFANGVAQFELGDGDSKTAEDLPAGINYVVTEENGIYTVTKTGDTGVISADVTVEAAFVNTLNIACGDLRVSKFVVGEGADQNRKFTFRITLNQVISGVYGDMTFENGVAFVQLSHGGTAVAKGLPGGIHYTVEELDGNDYIVSVENGIGTVSANATQQVFFINEYRPVNLPKTGDDTNLPMLFALMILSFTGCLILAKNKRTDH